MNLDPKLLAALSDPTRMHLLDLLREGEAAVGQLVQRSEVHQSGVSRHLAILHGAGLVTMRRDGQRRVYALRRQPFDDIRDWAEVYRAAWNSRLDQMEAALSKLNHRDKDSK